MVKKSRPHNWWADANWQRKQSIIMFVIWVGYAIGAVLWAYFTS